MTMADRIAIMDKGQVLQVATPAEIYEAPASRFVADFVGTINIFEGRLAERNAAYVRIADSHGRIIHARSADGAAVGDQVWFAIRPEKIRVSAERPEGAANALEGEVWDIGYLGDMTVYRIRLDDGRIVRTAAINSERVTEGALTWHDRAWISFAADAGVVLTR